MKRNIIFFFLFFFIFTSNNKILAEINISFVDIDYIYSNSKIGKKIDNQLESEKKKKKKKLNNYKKKKKKKIF